MPKFTAKKEPPKGRNLTYLEDPGIMTTLFLGSERWGARFLGSEQGDVQCILQEFTVTLVQLVIEETTYCFFYTHVIRMAASILRFPKLTTQLF